MDRYIKALEFAARLHNGQFRKKTNVPYTIGSVIIKWEKEKIITVKTKILALTMLWLMMGLTLYFSGIQIWLKMIIGICGVGISLYLLSFPSTKKQDV